jgi:hypothetical protein
MTYRHALVIISGLGVVAGCDDSSSEGGPRALAYWTDVAPVINDKCVRCHQPGGIAPFSLIGYSNVASRAALIAAVTKTRTMPPFLITHDGSCGHFEDSEALTEAQIATLQTWASSDLAEGTAVTLPLPSTPTLEGGTDYHTPVITPVAAGTALAEFDDYRCFLLDTNLARDRFITGYEVLPGRPEIVHHLAAFIVDPNRRTRSGNTNAEQIRALDAMEPDRLGWSCFAGTGEGLEMTAMPVVWAPGQGPIRYPDNRGVAQLQTDRLVVQVHYNLADAKNRGLMDSTTLRIRYADAVERPIIFLAPDGFLESLYTKTPPDSLPPGMRSVSYTWRKKLTEFRLATAAAFELLAVMPHMHQRGRRSELRILDDAGKNDCAARIEAWDFEWQKYYFYRPSARPVLGPDSELQLTCEYDTSREQSPVFPGWGTNNEMCLHTLMVSPR